MLNEQCYQELEEYLRMRDVNGGLDTSNL